MAERPGEVAAASLLTTWTDADTAMQIVGGSLGLFGTGLLDPTVVLSTETSLRNALFDILLSLVEGGAVEMRVAGDNRYAFRWRDDVAIAGLAPDGSTPIDLAVPSPYLAELERVQAERDEARSRAEFAEALAAERERLLRLAEAAPTATQSERTAPPKPAPPKPARRKPAAKPADPVEPVAAEALEVLFLTPADAPAKPEIDVLLEAYGTIDHVDAARAVEEVDEVDEVDEVEERPVRRAKWSGYSLDRSRNHLTSVDRLVEDG
jgi:hypothetical protein